MAASTPELAAMKERIHNLELALHGMWTMLRDLQPPATQASIDSLMAEHFDVSRALGGFEGTRFVGQHPVSRANAGVTGNSRQRGRK